MSEISIDLIMSVLWHEDPMNTGCASNEGMEDEYRMEAKEISQLLAQKVDLRTAILEVFDANFWPECLEDKIDRIIAQFNLTN